MCGIGVSVSGARIDSSSLVLDSLSPPPNSNPKPPPQQQQLACSLDDLKAALQRRGPDSFGCKKVVLLLHSKNDFKEFLLSSVIEDCAVDGKTSNEQISGISDSFAELYFFGATLQLRGLRPVSQPFSDSSGNVLVYNGEIFGGIPVGADCNDGEILMQILGECCSCTSLRHEAACSSSGEGKSSVAEVLSTIKGPWAIIYWQNSSRTMWFGRDAFGRRSLLVHWPTPEDSRFLLSSVSPFSSVDRSSDFEVENGTYPKFWEELSCGIYSLSMHASELDRCFVGEMEKHEWANSLLTELIKWERVSVKPNSEKLQFAGCEAPMGQHNVQLFSSGVDQKLFSLPAENVLTALRKSVMLRTSDHKNFQAVICKSRQEEFVPVAILFSGGLDSMILAALLDECIDPSCGIDLLNVSFDYQSAPDRITAKGGLKELRKIAPLRTWKLVEIDADLSMLSWEMRHVMSLINPADTYMDLNIGIALWLAASGDGWVCEDSRNTNMEIQQRCRYKSNARIVLVGSGADEQCAGYGRHRTKYRSGSWLGLHEEMKLDMQRIWKRNMGRDDRCIADNGKEARFPFLDEDVIRTLLDISLWEVANLDLPSGTGDKKILREVAQILGLHEAAVLPKRAIQFGSRIARESNRKNFGSNRAANQASAGSVVINRP